MPLTTTGTSQVGAPEGFGFRRDCPICLSERLVYLFTSYGYPIWRCEECGFLFRNPVPPEAGSRQDRLDRLPLHEETPQSREKVARLREAAAKLRLDRLQVYSGLRGGTLLEIGCGGGEFLLEAERLGFEVAGIEESPSVAETANARLGKDCVECTTLDNCRIKKGSLDVCVVTDVIEHEADPVWMLGQVRRLLKPGGVILLTAPSVDSWSAKLLKRNWMDFKAESLTFFGRATIENAIAKAGFEHVVLGVDESFLSPECVSTRREQARAPAIGVPPWLGHRVMPRFLRRRQIRGVAGRVMLLAHSATRSEDHKLSIILPAYDESATFTQVMDALVAKDLHGLEKEIIVVESNSTDGTREAALRYRDHPEVTLVLEDKPCGKGHAVRAGLARATGDFVLIQDADLEYDFNDYDALLEPLRNYRTAFVLGIRHGGDWKMRQFADNPWLAAFMNLGHVVFTALLNLLYGQRLKDPFTMFKVFRRDCLFGLDFESNRFDFDHELVIKLLRKGYKPLEIPVNYNSRPFSQGKKVRVLSDPITWIWALAKFRFVPLYKASGRIRW